MLQFLMHREVGEDPPFILERVETMRRTFSLELSGRKEMYCDHQVKPIELVSYLSQRGWRHEHLIILSGPN